MSIQITVPRLGWSMEEGTFMGWLKKEGEAVKAGQPLFVMESEKATQEVEATDSGVFRLQPESPKSGDIVKVGQVIGMLLAENEDAPNNTPAVLPTMSVTGAAPPTPSISVDGESKPAPVVESKSASASGASIPISPRARRRAAELGVDVTKLKGSGRGGRIREEDVVKRVTNTQAVKSVPTVKTSTMRRLIAQRTATSFATIPHFYLRVEVDATALVRLREDLLPEIESTTGFRVTLSDFLLRAQARALNDFPAANSIWVDDNLVPLPSCDIGLVVGLSEGLMIPVVRSANEGNLASITKQRAALVAAAKAGKLTQDQMQGGATSLSNLGNSVVDEFSAVISPDQSSMLSVGRAIARPYGFNGKLALRTTLKLCLSVDHRVLDGGPAGEFLGRVVELLETPDKLL
jgi:pyruvate dehydrogenase E2 component (dihydrolipoamide acetyltransferase)